MNYTFSAFGISVKHPEDYKVWFNPNKPFHKDEGDFRLDRMTHNKEEEVSMTVGWWTEEEPKVAFAENFLLEVDKQFKKRIADGSYEFFEKKIVDHMGHEAAFVYSGALGSSHVFRGIGKKVQLQTLQLAWFCDDCQKTVIAAVIAPSAYVQKEYPKLKEMLFSVQCHEGMAK